MFRNNCSKVSSCSYHNILWNHNTLWNQIVHRKYIDHLDHSPEEQFEYNIRLNLKAEVLLIDELLFS